MLCNQMKIYQNIGKIYNTFYSHFFSILSFSFFSLLGVGILDENGNSSKHSLKAVKEQLYVFNDAASTKGYLHFVR